MTTFEKIQDKGLLAAKGLQSLLMEGVGAVQGVGQAVGQTTQAVGSGLSSLLEKPIEGFRGLDPYTRAEIGGLVGQVIGEALTGREAPKMAETIRQVPVALRERKEKQEEKQIEKLKLLRETQKQSRDYGLKFKNNFIKDKSIQKSQQALDAANSVKALLETENPISDQAMRIQFPRLLGEVGNLTAQEQNMFGGSKAVLDKTKQAFKRWAQGKLTDDNREFLRELVGTLEISAARNYDKRANDLIESEVAASQGYIDKDYLNSIVDPLKKTTNLSFSSENIAEMSTEELKEMLGL